MSVQKQLSAAMLGAEWYRVVTGADGRLATYAVPHTEHVARCRAAVPNATEQEIAAAIEAADRYASWRDIYIWPVLYAEHEQ